MFKVLKDTMTLMKEDIRNINKEMVLGNKQSNKNC